MFSRLLGFRLPLSSPRAVSFGAHTALALGLTFVLSSVSCSRFTRTKQCRALIAQVNPALDEVLALADAGVGGSAGGSGSVGLGGNVNARGGAGGSANVGLSAATAGADGARYISAAARYERLAKDLGPMEFSSEQMAKNVAEYASILTASAQALRSLASALDANNAAEVERTNRELEHLSIREHSAIARMDAWCQSD